MSETHPVSRMRAILDDALACIEQADRTFDEGQALAAAEHQRRNGREPNYIKQRRPVGISTAMAKIQQALALLPGDA